MTQIDYTPDFIAWFWSKVDRDGPVPDYAPHLGPCWLWLLKKSKDGYGRFQVRQSSGPRKTVTAHQIAWIIDNGPVPEGLILDHLCRVRLCVRPSHCDATTRAENNLRGFGAAAQNARKTRCKRGHADFQPHPSNPSYRICATCKRLAKKSA